MVMNGEHGGRCRRHVATTTALVVAVLGTVSCGGAGDTPGSMGGLDGRTDASPERGDDEFDRDSEFGWAEVCEGDGDTGPGDERGCVVPGGEEGL